MDNNNILKLNDFISYDVEREVFIVKEHTIKIKAQEFSFDTTWKTPIHNKYRGILKQIHTNDKIKHFMKITEKQPKQRNKNGNMVSNWNVIWRSYKEKMEYFIKKNTFPKEEFDIFTTEQFWIWLRKSEKS